MGDQYLQADEAAALLGVKRQTLYAYVSRGWLESVPDPRSSRSRLYNRVDLDRLRARSDARAGDAPVAAAALRWGAPVLETSICEITETGPAYRGHRLADLVGNNSFEQVAELLWSGALPAEVSWEHGPAEGRVDGVTLTDRLRAAALHAELADPTRDVRTDAAANKQATRLLSAMADALGGTGVHPSFAARVAAALALDRGETTVRAVEVALIVCAEHELNASAFATRVAASTGANLYASVTAGLAAFVGPRHGGLARRIHRLLAETTDSPRDALLERLSAGESIPGFGHPLYPAGDPRFDLLWAAALAVEPDALHDLRALIDAAAAIGLEPPNLDMGLVAVTVACRLREGSEAAIFAMGRTAGWIAHAREQAGQGFLLRPRARYVGIAPE